MVNSRTTLINLLGILFTSLPIAASYADDLNISKQIDNTLSYLQENIDTKPSNVITSPIDERVHLEKKIERNNFAIVFYKPNYLMPIFYSRSPYYEIYDNDTPSNEKLMRTEMQYQFSFKVPIWKNIFNKSMSLHLAYTQKSFWQAYNRNAFFRETDYEPELFLAIPCKLRLFKIWNIDFFNIGAIHQSNGFGDGWERSWNRIYLELITSMENWMLSIQPWYIIKDDTYIKHNANMNKYLGYGKVTFAYKYDKHVFAITARNYFFYGFHYPATELTWSFPLTPHLNGYLQLFSGYGQSLIEYDHRTNSIGVGIAFSNWI